MVCEKHNCLMIESPGCPSAVYCPICVTVDKLGNPPSNPQGYGCPSCGRLYHDTELLIKRIAELESKRDLAVVWLSDKRFQPEFKIHEAIKSLSVKAHQGKTQGEADAD